MTDSSWLWRNHTDADLMLTLYGNSVVVSHTVSHGQLSITKGLIDAGRMSLLQKKPVRGMQLQLDNHDCLRDQDSSVVATKTSYKESNNVAKDEEPVCMELAHLGPELDMHIHSGVLDLTGPTSVLRRQDDPGTALQAETGSQPHFSPSCEPTMSKHLLHSTLVASVSDYFRKSISTEVGRSSASQRSSESSHKYKYEMNEFVEEALQPAAECVLKLMYTHVIEDPCDISLLLGMLQVR